MARTFRTPIDLGKLEIRNVALQNLASAPSSPAQGQIYFDTSTSPGKAYWWNGSAWIDPLARANHSGTQLAATISDFDTQVRTSRLDQMAAPTASVSLNTQKITNLATPTLSGDAVTKAYADALFGGHDWKDSVRAASTANVSVTYGATGGTSARGQITAAPNTLDGVSLAANDRILLKDQTTGAQNGIWVVTTLGSGANGVWDRATDFDQDAEVTAGATIPVAEGTSNADTIWLLTTNDPIVIGGGSGTALTFTNVPVGTLTAGAGLTRTGNTIDVIAGATPGTGGPGGGLKVNTDDVVIDTAVVVRKFAQTFGDNSAVAFTLTHNLGTQDVTVSVYLVASPFAEVECDVEHATTNTVILRFAVAPTTNELRAVCHG